MKSFRIKLCLGCNTPKDLTQFESSKRGKCKTCRRAYFASYPKDRIRRYQWLLRKIGAKGHHSESHSAK